MSLSILFVGNFEPAHSTENHLAKTLVDMGHDVTEAQEVGHYAVTADQVVVELFKYDLLMWVRTPPGLKGDSVRMLETAKKLGIPTVAYHLDLFAPISRKTDVDTEPWWKCEYVITADGGSDPFWKEHGINHFWLSPGVYRPECYPAESTGFKHEVIFTGQRSYHIEWPYRPQLIDFLAETYGKDFHRFPMPGEAAVRNEALNQLYADTKIVIGDSLVLNFTHKYYWSDRLNEVLGRGGFMIFPRIKGLEDHVIEDKEIVLYTFGDFDELKSKIDYYLSHDDEREEIRLAGHKRILKDGTYHNRMDSMLKIIGMK